ncbi:MAG: PIN domain-containing protein [Mycolicibacterium sp.]|uniref:type II toxin-antitoxin system VapC family toxin n=1 Tax=Mycobacteriaceae TaxID=1762 RepID=UPI000F90C0AA|nr:type II toxin-antitoxin system VapC family toxin [Mycolicibacterium sp.]RUP32600.1 MAG: PIN domain-containing protein [Mycolicibacterium sp.]
MIYLDTTAMLKLIAHEPETPALTDYLQARTDTVWFTCSLARAELLRATATMEPDATDHARHILDGLDTVAMTDRLVTAAANLTPAPRRTLDALHIAAALTAGPQLHTLITYDPELTEAAGRHHITTTHPGGSL